MRYAPEELAQVKEFLPAGAPLPSCPRQAALDCWMELPGISVVVSGSSMLFSPSVRPQEQECCHSLKREHAATVTDRALAPVG